MRSPLEHHQLKNSVSTLMNNYSLKHTINDQLLTSSTQGASSVTPQITGHQCLFQRNR